MADNADHRSLWPKANHLVGSFLLLLAVACAGFSPESRLVDVGGRLLHISCAGEGAPAVLLDSGLASDDHDWEPVSKRVSEFTLVCSYDRAGLGESGPAPVVSTSQTASDDIHSLLTGAGIPGPVVLAGHSYGGLNVRLYAAQHPENTAGLILVDSLHPDNLARAAGILGEQAMAVLLQAVQSNPEGVDMVASLEQVKAAGGLGATPLTVITAGGSELPPFIDRDVGGQLTNAWQEMQRELVRLSSAGEQTIAEESGHCVQCHQPELVADVILRMVERAQR